MTGAAIARREAGGTLVLSVHGCFDGAAAWALRIEMDESAASDFVVDLTCADEACDFAAAVLERYVRQRWREKRIRFVPGNARHARVLASHGLDLCEELPPVVFPPPPIYGGTGAAA